MSEALSLSELARLLDRRDQLTEQRAALLQLAAEPDRPGRYKCSHVELGGMGWSHPWPDEPMVPHACCGVGEHCPSRWIR